MMLDIARMNLPVHYHIGGIFCLTLTGRLYVQLTGSLTEAVMYWTIMWVLIANDAQIGLQTRYR